jgi:hypothetical protein
MTSRRNQGDGALLGMIVDRSSFDQDDELSRSQSFDEESVRIKNGRVRRKLKWKPPGLSLRRKQGVSSAQSIRTEQSTKTNRSFQSFHTFNSTETPVLSNKKIQKEPKVMPRPNYPDTFEGMSTIDNESSFVHSRISTHDSDISRSHTMPSRYEDIGFISADESTESSGSAEKSTYDPFEARPPKSGKKTSLRSLARSAAKSRNASRPPVHRPNKPPKHPIPKEPVSPKPYDSPRSQELQPVEESFPVLTSEDVEQDRRIDFFSANSSIISASSSLSGADAAAGIGVSPLRTISPGARTPSPVSLSSPTQRQVTPETSTTRKPPMSPPLTPPPAYYSAYQRAQHVAKPVPAKVNIDLDSPKTLGAMIQNSGLFSQYNITFETDANGGYESPTRRAYHRPVDSMAVAFHDSPVSSLAQHDDDDSLSTRSPGSPNANVIVIPSSNGMEQVLTVMGHSLRFSNRQSPEGMSGTRTPSPTSTRLTHRRRSVGPVDVDQGRFLEAERNLKAIHQMAAEHLSHGEYEEALEVFEEILRGQRERYGAEHYRVGTALHNIGIVHLKSKNYEKAIEVCREAVRVRKEALVPNHPDIAVSLAQLGVAHLECQQHREALIVFREALQIRRGFLGPKHPKVGKILNNIGCALYELEELDGARLAFEEALDIQRENLRSCPAADEEEHGAQSNQALLSIASTLCNLGSIKLRWGHYGDASVVLEEALLIQQSVLGDDHPAVLATIESIEHVDSEMGLGRRSRSVFGFPTSVEEAAQKAAACNAGAQPAMRQSMKNFKGIMSLGLSRSQRLYQRVEDILVAETSDVCGPIGPEDVLSNDGSYGSVSTTRRRRAEV